MAAITCSVAVQLRGDPESPVRCRGRDHGVAACIRRKGRRRQFAQRCSPLLPRRAVKRSEAASREERARDVERAAERLTAADRNDLRAGGQRVLPLRRGGHARAHDRHLRGVLVRLVGVHDARIPLECGGKRKAGMAGREEDVRKRPFAVQLEATRHRDDVGHPVIAEAGIEAAADPNVGRMREEVVDPRVIAARRRSRAAAGGSAAARLRGARARESPPARDGRRTPSASAAAGSQPPAAASARSGRRRFRRRRSPRSRRLRAAASRTWRAP